MTNEPMTMNITVSIPGAVVAFLQGTTGYQMHEGDTDYWGDPEKDAQAYRMFDALRAAPARKAGKGVTYRFDITEPWGLITLINYLEDIVEVNEYGDRDNVEYAAAKRVLKRLMPEARKFIQRSGLSWEPTHPSTEGV